MSNETTTEPKKERKQKISEQAAAKPPGTELVIPGRNAPVLVDFSKATVVRSVATPQLSLKGEAGLKVAITITSPITAKDEVGEDGKPKKGVASCKVTDLTDGIEKAMVTPVIVRSEFERTYPDNGYVGRSFVLTKGATRTDKAVGRQFNMWDIVEIDISQAIVQG